MLHSSKYYIYPASQLKFVEDVDVQEDIYWAEDGEMKKLN